VNVIRYHDDGTSTTYNIVLWVRYVWSKVELLSCMRSWVVFGITFEYFSQKLDIFTTPNCFPCFSGGSSYNIIQILNQVSTT